MQSYRTEFGALMASLCASLPYPELPETVCQNEIGYSLDLVSRGDVEHLQAWHRQIIDTSDEIDIAAEDSAICQGNDEQAFLLRFGGLVLFRIEIARPFTQPVFAHMTELHDSDYVLDFQLSPLCPHDLSVFLPAFRWAMECCLDFSEVERLITRINGNGDTGVELLAHSGFQTLPIAGEMRICFLDRAAVHFPPAEKA